MNKKPNTKSSEELIAELEDLWKQTSTGKSSGAGLLIQGQNEPGKVTDQEKLTILQNAGSIISYFNRELKLEYINRPPGGVPADLVVGKGIHELVHPDFIDEATKVINGVFKTGHPSSFISRNAGRELAETWFESQVTPIIDKKKVSGVVIVSNEISERIKTEQALKESEERFRLLSDSTFEGIAITQHGIFIDCNQAFLKLYGYKKEELIGTEVLNLVAPEDRDLVKNKIKAEYDEPYDHKSLHKNGTVVVVEVSGKSINYFGKTCRLTAVRDITERKKFEKDLKTSEARFKKVYTTAPFGIELYDHQGNLVDANAKCLEIFGIENVNEIKGFKLFEDPNLSAEMKDKLTSGEYVTFESEFDFERVKELNLYNTSRSGKCQISVNISPWFLDNFQKNGYLVFVREVTERKKIMADLKKYEQIFAASTDYLALLDKNYVYLVINDAYLKGLGKSRKEIVGRSVPELFGKELFITRQKPNIDRCLAGETVQYQVWIDFPGAGRKFMDVTHIPYKEPDGAISGYLVNARDITKLKISETNYRVLVDSAAQPIFIVHKDGTFLFMNEMSAKMLGGRPAELTGKKMSDLFPPEVAQGQMSVISEAIQTGKLVTSTRESIVNKKKMWFSAQVQPMLNAVEEYDRVQVILTDISRLKEAEERLAQAQKLEAIGTLAGGIAHDFNNILGVIMGYTELTLDSLEQDNDLRNNLIQVMKSSDRAKEMVQQILMFSRKTQETMKPVNIAENLSEAVKFLQSTIPSTIEIQTFVDKNLNLAFANPTQITQIIMNLCTNAAHAMSENGGLLELTLKQTSLGLKASSQFHLPAGKYLELMVSDTGYGMSRETLARIFDPYFTTKRVGEGSGMGLAVVHGIVKNHGGGIQVESQPGKGSTFRIFLPVIQEPTENPKHLQQKTPAIPKGNERIILVEDEPNLAEMGLKMLESLGYKVEMFTDSTEALKSFKKDKQKYDLLLTDMTMPGMTGIDLAKEVHKLSAQFPVILCTGFSDRINEDNYRQLGINGYIMKPMVKRDLARIIRQVLDQDNN